MNILGWILVGYGAIILALTDAGRRWDHPDARRTSERISAFLIFIGLILLLVHRYGN